MTRSLPMHKLTLLTLVGAAGAIGSLARYGLTVFVVRQTGTAFPWGTLAVNALGCLVVGFLWELCGRRELLSEEWRAIILVGGLGAFTTFATYVLDSSRLLAEQGWWPTLANVAAQNGLGFLCLFAGIYLARLV